ncbi:patatin-like phospholipase family protein [Schlegelella sp. S2-27]|uniref:Patatin-like phospholipase family protein n=1 Tax=Caldimonas mangrovi TaxID=2944811 RepID=A0ABT0YPQ8_9BURK|nr:patatin-like phospholipase family protein [Caldimonas mangrovi]MCM5680721.1 patatin-like phospholipase family protein [Caldimonas mangrovi]
MPHTAKTAVRPRPLARHHHPSRVGLALAGGGPLGAIYEIGALCALDESLQGLDFTQCHSYVGVSAGGFIAAGLANGMRPRELCRAFIENEGGENDLFDPTLLIRPAYGEFVQRLATLPGLLASAGFHYAFGRRSLMSAFERVGRAIPTGLFSNRLIDHRLQRMFAQPGRTNDFRALERQLVLVATDLDSGQAAPFGLPGWDDVPISKAVQASAALPGLFPPVEIGGRSYVDGALKKTMHASVLLEQGLDLLICLNPLVPFDASRPQPSRGTGRQRIPRIADGGLPVVLSQTFRSMIHSRLELGMKGYERAYPATDIVLFEPDQRDAELFLANTFSYAQRRRLAEHAYQQTRQMLRARHAVLGPRLAPHGITLDLEMLSDTQRTLVGMSAPVRSRAGRALRELEQTLDELERRLAVA